MNKEYTAKEILFSLRKELLNYQMLEVINSSIIDNPVVYNNENITLHYLKDNAISYIASEDCLQFETWIPELENYRLYNMLGQKYSADYFLPEIQELIESNNYRNISIRIFGKEAYASLKKYNVLEDEKGILLIKSLYIK